MDKALSKICVLVAFLLSSVTASATILNPDVANYGADNGTEYFQPEFQATFLEAFDSASTIAPTRFGFYRSGAPGTLTTIFDTTDGTTDSSLVNFADGFVVDLDEFQFQNAFVAGTGVIGFFLELDLISQGLGLLTIYSDASLNDNGLDLMAFFPSLTDPNSFFIGAELPFGQDQFATVYLALSDGITPVHEPPLLALMGLGLLAMVSRRRKI